MALVSCYDVIVTREGGSWLAKVPAERYPEPTPSPVL
jgi:hypothetical protein